MNSSVDAWPATLANCVKASKVSSSVGAAVAARRLSGFPG